MEGESLAKRTERQPATIEDAIQWMIEVCEGLEYAHSMGVVHRDLKPQNILLDPSGRLKILDFGMAKTLQDTELTQTNSGAILGTPAYMSPEQAAGCGSEHGVASDIYSCGVILFQWMTGELPFRGKAQSVLYQVSIQSRPVPSQLNREISKELETICLKCLEKDPRDRYPSARALQDELKARAGRCTDPSQTDIGMAQGQTMGDAKSEGGGVGSHLWVIAFARLHHRQCFVHRDHSKLAARKRIASAGSAGSPRKRGDAPFL